MAEVGSGEIVRRGWVLWRDNPNDIPQWRFGDLRVRDGLVYCDSEGNGERPAQDGDLFIIPGFVDLHCHLAIQGGPLTSDQIRAHAWEEIRAGVLAVREPGSPVKVSPGELPFGRPIVISAGRHIALEKRYNRGLAVELPGDPAEGPVPNRTAALVAEVQRQAAAGDGWVKLVGDWIDRSDGPDSTLRPLWSREETLAAVEAAHEAGAKVAVHTFSPEPIDDLLDAGVDSIEHGMGMTPEQMARARDLGIAVVPTLVQVLKFPEFAASATRFPRYNEVMTALYEGRHRWFEGLLASGVQILPGSDAGGYQEHGAVIDELERLVEWGMPASQVLSAATWQARDYLGLDSLSEGAPADCVIFDRDPSTTPEVWSTPVEVIAAGHVVRP